MKSKKIVQILIVGLLVSGLSFGISSCKKDEAVVDASDDISLTKEQLAAEAMVEEMEIMAEDVMDITMDSIKGPAMGPKPPHWGPCATITIVPFDSITWPKTITVDFGPVNCLCNDGKYRRGQIVTIASAPPMDSLSTRITNSINYYVNDHLVEGTRTSSNLGHINGMLTHTNSLLNGKITRPNGDSSTMNAQHTRVFAAGESTPYPVIYDDVWLLSGSKSGTMFNGTSYSMTITNPLEIPRACSWIVSGTKEMQRGNKPLRTIDFGNGSCDNIATVTVNGVTQTIYLP